MSTCLGVGDKSLQWHTESQLVFTSSRGGKCLCDYKTSPNWGCQSSGRLQARRWLWLGSFYLALNRQPHRDWRAKATKSAAYKATQKKEMLQCSNSQSSSWGRPSVQSLKHGQPLSKHESQRRTQKKQKLKKDVEELKPNHLRSSVFPRRSSDLNVLIGNAKAVVCWPTSIAISGAGLGTFLPGYTEHTETCKLPHKYVIEHKYAIEQGGNQALFLHWEYFPHKIHVSNYIFFLKWRTPRVSHIPPINSNESLMARTANNFFQNMVGGSNFYFNRPVVAKRQKKVGKKTLFVKRYGACVFPT